MLHIFTLLACVLTANAVRFNESDLIIELKSIFVYHDWDSNHTLSIETLKVHFIRKKAWGIHAAFNVTSDQLNSLKWTLQTDEAHNGTFVNDGSGESEKKDLAEICGTAVWDELVRSRTISFTCLPAPGFYRFLSTPVDFTRFYPEDRELFHGQKMRYWLRFYDGDSLASCVVMALAVRTQNEVDEDVREFNRRVQEG